MNTTCSHHPRFSITVDVRKLFLHDNLCYHDSRRKEPAKMAQIIVREIENDVKERLQRRAARHGRSMEAEVRDILRDAVKRDRQRTFGLGTAIAVLFSRIGFEEGETIHELRGFIPQDPFK